MTQSEINEYIRKIVTYRLNKNYKKSNIYYTLFQKFVKETFNKFLNRKIEFGIKSFDKIANTLGYNAFVIFIPSDDFENKQMVFKLNQQFLDIIESFLDDIPKITLSTEQRNNITIREYVKKKLIRNIKNLH